MLDREVIGGLVVAVHRADARIAKTPLRARPIVE
jgi:hypothetical protein